jgi:hypothetical protein
MFFRPFLGFFMKTVEVSVQLGAVDPPDPSPAQLDGRHLAGPDQGIDLGNADAQVCGHVLQSQESRLETGGGGLGAFRSALRRGHRPTIAPGNDRSLDLVPFAAVWQSDKEA